MLQKVTRSTIIDAPIERVWAVLRDFNSHDQWHSAVKHSRIDGGERSDQVGCVRNFELQDGNRIQEQLLTLSDRDHKSSYCIVQATVPLQRYVATLTLKPVTDGNRTFWHWESTFATPVGMERELSDMVGRGVYETGFADLRRHLQTGADLRLQGSAPMPTALPMATRQMTVRQYGEATQMLAEDGECPAPKAGEVRLRQRTIGINYFDIYLRKGWIPPMFPLPGVLGLEAAGSVIDVGADVHGYTAGDRVAYLGPVSGAYTSVRCVPDDWVVRLPAAVNDDVAAALLMKGITADYLLRDLGRIQKGSRLLVHAAAGGVGLLVCAWARSLGAVVMGTVSSDDKARVARAYGCEHVIVTRDYQFADAVKSIAGGADVVIDGLGEAAFDQNFAALARCGHWISLGQASGGTRAIDPNLLVSKSLTFSRPAVFDFVASKQAFGERAQRVWDALAQGVLLVPPIERFSLEAAPQAHARLESRATVGALVLMA
jgi:NADPH:quinone reductase